MRQTGLSMEGFEGYRKVTRREAFLADMNKVVPWHALVALIASVYPQAGNGRPPVGIERMLRIHLLQHGFNLSDPGVEEALYDSPVMRRFAGIDLGIKPVPDETTSLRFRHLLEAHELGEKFCATVHQHPRVCGLKVATGPMVDATMIAAPRPTKHRDRAPAMHQTKQGNPWHFGMQAHIGGDSKTRLIHRVAATAANGHDAVMLPDLLHGGATRVWGERAYQGHTDVIRDEAPRARDVTHRRCRRPGVVNKTIQAKHRPKSNVRAKVEHALGVIKNGCGFVKVPYRGLAKNANRLFVACALANLYLAKRHVLRLPQGRCA